MCAEGSVDEQMVAFYSKSRGSYEEPAKKAGRSIGAIGALMNIVLQPRTLLVRGRNAEMGTAAGADELVSLFCFFTLVTGPRRSLSLKLSNTRVYEPQIRFLGFDQPRNYSLGRPNFKVCIESEFFSDNLLVRIHFIIEMIWWTGLAPWEFEF